MWTIYIIGSLIILFYIIYKTNIKKKLHLTSRFSILIRLVLKLDKDLVIENAAKNDLTLFSSNTRGSITIFIVQYYGIISIIIESATLENSTQKKEWMFLDNINQYLIFNQIVNDIQSFTTSSFDQQLINKLVDKSTATIHKIIFTNPYSPYNIAQSFFCIALTEIEKINSFQKISQKGSFEVLFFNCLITLEKSEIKQQNQLWDELVTLLVFYLENHNLMNQIKDLEGLLEDRITFYSEQIEQIKLNPAHNYNTLYYYFFQHPLSMREKQKRFPAISGETQYADFSKTLIIMIADIKEKLPILQNLIF